MRYAILSGCRTDVRSEAVFDRMRGFCPECGKPVQSFKGRNSRDRGGDGQSFHFRHVRGESSECTYDRVSPLHDFAQHCLIESGGMMVPVADGRGLFEGTGRWITFSERPRMEYLVRGLEGSYRRVDVMAESDDESIAVEVTVTNALSSSRVKSLKAMGYQVLEIDLTDYSLTDFNEAEIREAVVNRTSCKIWRREGDRRRKVIPAKPVNDEETLLQAASQMDMLEQARRARFGGERVIGVGRLFQKILLMMKRLFFRQLRR